MMFSARYKPGGRQNLSSDEVDKNCDCSCEKVAVYRWHHKEPEKNANQITETSNKVDENGKRENNAIRTLTIMRV